MAHILHIAVLTPWWILCICSSGESHLCFSHGDLISYIRIHTHTSHTLSLWLFHNCYSQGQNDSSRLFSASPLPTPPAFPAGQEAPQLCSQLSHHLICQILGTTLMWKGAIAVLCCNKKGCFLKDHYTSAEPLWAIPHPLLTCRLGGDFPLSEAPASCKLQEKPDTHSSWLRYCCNQMTSTACWSSRKLSSSQSCSFLTTFWFWPLNKLKVSPQWETKIFRIKKYVSQALEYISCTSVGMLNKAPRWPSWPAATPTKALCSSKNYIYIKKKLQGSFSFQLPRTFRIITQINQSSKSLFKLDFI